VARRSFGSAAASVHDAIASTCAPLADTCIYGAGQRHDRVRLHVHDMDSLQEAQLVLDMS
jgi:hypothetical protein